MTEQIQRKLSESKTARWSVLALVAFTMLCGYFITDMMAPLQDLLQTPVEGGGLGWTANEYGKFTSAYGWFNVFFLMLIFGGMILDKMGVRFTGLMATSIMLIGVFIKWFGISHNFDGATVTVFGSEYGYPLVIASLGYALFGVGVEIAGITVSKIIVKWFKTKTFIFTGHANQAKIKTPFQNFFQNSLAVALMNVKISFRLQLFVSWQKLRQQVG